ncbi:organic cation transporter protein-like isoform X2 [Ruditapes philippinarum]|uniref:organic cation transporter protein-like isoform X2 n=1 Tax=Ruditapes philippinarum TaxID=129788 RepID=UPI00295B50FD|nr:organic cation transporter protein-like isoform X2 [Ruditapes philippinarum]
MYFDLVYDELGEFGLFSKYIVYVGSITSIYAGFLFVNTFFILGIPDHRCALPGWDNDTYEIQNDLHLAAINRTIPLAPPTESFKYDQCSYRTVSENGLISEKKCDSWVYDKSIFSSSLAADLNMVCDRAILKSNAQMVFFGGLLAGSFLTGLFSDRFGRKPTMCLSSIFYFLAAMGIAWTPSYVVYVFLTFCVGFFAVGNFMPSFVMGMEFVGPSKRRFAGLVGGYYWMVGNLILAGLGYGIRDWSTLQIVCAAPGIFFQLFWIIFPESPRWLYTQGRLEECKAIIRKAAKWDKVSLPDKFFNKVFQEVPEPNQGKLWHLFTNRTLCIRTLIIFFNWFVVCLAYYGLALNSGDLGGNMYLNFFLQAFMDFPATTITLVLLDRTGRKPLLVGSMIIGGLGCLGTVFTIMYGGEEYSIATKVLAMLGKIGASAAFSMVYVYSAELFPTVVRNAGMGSSSCMARVGGMIAPYIADLDRLVGGSFGKALPQVVFGTLSIIAGLLALYLPETLKRSLPETIEQGIKFGSDEEEKVKESDKEIHINKAFDDSLSSTHL